MGTHKYAAFLSYAHADEAVAKRLHSALETFSLPKNLRATAHDRLTPIFRDQADMSAHHSLSERIKDALVHSRYLIVMCSPAAKTSRWVNEEIRLFREQKGDKAILCALVDGTPEDSFPPALTEGGREPLAADLSGGRDSFRLGTTQLTAALIETDLDSLIQRTAKRRQRRAQLVSAASLALAGVMGGTALVALDARQEAEDRRNDAEGLIEYMLTDLKAKLEPVGRLDVLDSVGDKVNSYYESQDAGSLSDTQLARQSRAFHLLGQVAMDSGKMEEAISEFEKAAIMTEEVLSRNPEDTHAIFTHAQSMFWVGEAERLNENYDAVESYWQKYNDLGQILYEINPNNFDWIMEAAWGANNLGMVAIDQKKPDKALKLFSHAIKFFEKAQQSASSKDVVQYEMAITLSLAANAAQFESSSHLVINYLQSALEKYDAYLSQNPQNLAVKAKRSDVLEQLRSTIEKSNIGDIESFNTIDDAEIAQRAKFDPTNRNWRWDDFRRNRQKAESSLETNNLKQINNAYFEYKEIYNQYENDFKPLAPLTNIYHNYLLARFEIFKNNRKNALEFLSLMEHEFLKLDLNKNHHHIYDQTREGLILMMRISADLEHPHKTKTYANNILVRLEGIPDPHSVAIDFDLLEAYLGASKCDKYHRLYNKLLARDYKLQISENITKLCQISKLNSMPQK